MTQNNHDKLYSILLDIKQDIGEMKYEIGEIKGEARGAHEQSRKTNGRLKKAEDDIDKLRSFIDNYKGKLTVIVFIAGIVLPAIVSVIAKYL